jgi:hypothetical protein
MLSAVFLIVELFAVLLIAGLAFAHPFTGTPPAHLAVAGFTMDNLSVQIEDNQLVIRGKQEEDKDRVYLHRGIAARQFQRSFVLADGIEVAGAWLDNGLLNIDLVRRVIEHKPRTVEIRNLGKPSRQTVEQGANKERA